MSTPLWSDKLTQEQVIAASHFGSHARLLAGPGTGKTHTLARRVVYLVTEKQTDPSEILVLTFTRMATRQLRSNIREQLSAHTKDMPHIATLHSFSLRQLVRNSKLINNLPQPLRIADDWEEDQIIIEDLKLLLERKRTEIEDGFKKLSADWQTLNADADDWKRMLPDPAFVGMWEEHRTVYGYTMRAELVYQLKRALAQIADFELEPRFKHVLIDEYQDLNPCDLAVAQAIAARGVALMACGDDDQSIYGFRFADPTGIRNVIDQYAESANLLLTECRRCDAEILEAAMWVAEQDARRVKKDLRAADGNTGGEVHLLQFANGQSEALGVAKLCRQLIDAGTRPGQILILLRSDRNGVLSQPVQQALERCNVPVTANVEKRNVLDELPGRKLLSMLRIVMDPNDHLAWRTRFRVFGRVGPKTIAPFYDFARRHGIGFSGAVRRMSEFADQLSASAPRLLDMIITSTLASAERFSTCSADHDPDADPPTSAKLLEMITAIVNVELTSEDGHDEVLGFLTEVIASSDATTLEELFAALAANREEIEADLDEDRVNILTMHQAKGLSADAVFVIAAEDEILPRYLTASNIEDDRRLLYVSMTRARHKLFVTYCGRRERQQRFSGRNSGDPQRHLTQFLRNSSLPPVSGEEFVQARS